MRSECNLVVNKTAGLIVVFLIAKDARKNCDDDEVGRTSGFFDIGICFSK